MKTRLGFFVVAALGLWALKRYYADAGADDLWWILRPTATLVATITGTTFALLPGEGFFCRERLFLIEKSCAGINFMIAAAGMTAFVLSGRVRGWRSCACIVVGSTTAGYTAALVVNAARIAMAMWLAAHPLAFGEVASGQLHRVEGIVIYFAGLVLLHELVNRSQRRFLRAEATT